MSLINLDDARNKYSKNLSGNQFSLQDGTKKFDVFLSHSYKDREDAAVAKNLLEDFGVAVYLDWHNDPEVDRKKATYKTAELLRTRMKESKKLIYLVTENYKSSLWMPWELGFFDGNNQEIEIAILPMVRQANDYKSSVEYLAMYPYIDMARSDIDEADTLWVNDPVKENTYISLAGWLQGKKPKPRG